MILYTHHIKIGQLEKRRGGYFYLEISAQVVETFPQQRKTRLICHIEEQLSFQCGLNYLGDGNFFIIVSGKNLKKIDRGLGDVVSFQLEADPNPLGVEVPEVLEVLLAQDSELHAKYEQLSMGKKRHVIHSINRIKNIDKQVQKAIEMIELHGQKKRKPKAS